MMVFVINHASVQGAGRQRASDRPGYELRPDEITEWLRGRPHLRRTVWCRRQCSAVMNRAPASPSGSESARGRPDVYLETGRRILDARAFATRTTQCSLMSSPMSARSS